MHPNVMRLTAAAHDLGLAVATREFSEGTRTAEDAARAIGCEVGQIVKSLVFLLDGEPVMALVSGANRLEEQRLVAALGGEAVARADADVVRAATGYPIGGVPPFGHATLLPTVIDEDLLGYDEVWAAAGTPRDVFPIAPADLARATAGTVAPLRETTGPSARQAERAGMGQDDRTPRLATADDADEVARLLHDFNAEFDTPSPGATVLADRLRVLLAGNDTIAILAGTPAVAVALVTLRPNVWYAGEVAVLDELYVAPHLRGQGIGSAIIDDLMSIARARGVDLIEINVDEGDVDAQRFYERLGFSSTEPDATERAFYYHQELTP